jgi:hypothetical protein
VASKLLKVEKTAKAEKQQHVFGLFGWSKCVSGREMEDRKVDIEKIVFRSLNIKLKGMETTGTHKGKKSRMEAEF